MVGDRVVEVNGVNVESMSHSEVVNQIRTNPVKAVLLVVDKITDAYLKKINRPITASLSSYTDVHEMTIEEAEKLKELRLKDETENEEGENVEEKKENNKAEREHEVLTEDAEDKTDSSPESPQEQDVAQQQKEKEASPPSTPSIPPSQNEINGYEEEKIDECVQQQQAENWSEEKSTAVEDVSSITSTTTLPPSENQPSKVEEYVEQKETYSNHSSPQVEKSNFQVKDEKSVDDISPAVIKKESKNDKLKKLLSKPPKRKEVKQKNTDWKSKLNEFNNL